MKQKELLRELRKVFDECLTVCDNKNNDYAKGDIDAFSNFNGISRICDIPTEKVFFQFVTVKILRIAELLKKKAMNESLADSLTDIINYSALWKIYRKEK